MQHDHLTGMETERESQLLHSLAQDYFASIEQSSFSRIKELLLINHEEGNSKVPCTRESPERNITIANINGFDDLISSDSVQMESESTHEQTICSSRGPSICSPKNFQEDVLVTDSLESEEMDYPTAPDENEQHIDLINDSPANNDKEKGTALIDSLSEMQDSLEFEVMGGQDVEEKETQDSPCRENCRYGQNEASESPSLLQKPISPLNVLPDTPGSHDSPPLPDTYEVLSERLVNASASFDGDNTEKKQANAEDKEDGRGGVDERSKENASTTQEVLKGSRNKKGKRVDIIARNKRNLGNVKSQGSYAKHRNRTLHTAPHKTPNVQSQSPDTECNDNCGKNTAESQNSDFDQGLNFNSMSQSWHIPPLPPIGEPTHSHHAVQSAPADLYKLSYLIQEERKKLMDAGILTPLYHNDSPNQRGSRNPFMGNALRDSFSMPKVPHQTPVSDHLLNTQGHSQQGSYGNWFANTQNSTSTADPLHIRDSPVSLKNQMHVNGLAIRRAKQSSVPMQQKGYLEIKKSYAKKQKEYADIVKRQPHKAKFSLQPTKANSADHLKESKRLAALNYSKSIPKPSKSARKIPSEAKLLSKAEGSHDNILEIMKQRHELEKKEVERLRRELSMKLRSGR